MLRSQDSSEKYVAVKMVTTCCAMDCKNRETDESKSRGISFHCIPKEKVRNHLLLYYPLISVVNLRFFKL